jgi:hypothetical protein
LLPAQFGHRRLVGELRLVVGVLQGEVVPEVVLDDGAAEVEVALVAGEVARVALEVLHRHRVAVVEVETGVEAELVAAALR